MANIAVLCSNNSILGESGHRTGVSLLELAPVVYELERAGHVVELMSPHGGGLVLDPGTLDLSNPIVRDYYERVPFLQRLQNTSPLEDLSQKDYVALVACGGWNCIKDFYLEKATGSHIAAASLRYLAVVGYAQCLLLHEDLQKKFSKEKISGPIDGEDRDIGFQHFWNLSLSKALPAAGYTYVSSQPWMRHTVESNALITGQNAFSAQAVGEVLVKKLNAGV